MRYFEKYQSSNIWCNQYISGKNKKKGNKMKVIFIYIATLHFGKSNISVSHSFLQFELF